MNFASPTPSRSLPRRLARLLPVLALALSLPVFAAPSLGCSAGGAYAGNGFGATPGGVQDLGLARQLVAEGVVPPAAAFVVEGMFAEHDLPLAGGACERTLCIRGAGAVAPDAAGAPAGWVQLGLSSSIDPGSFERPSATVVLIVDVSGSMGWGSGVETPGEISRDLLHAIADGLGAGDDVALVTYGSTVDVPRPLAPHDAAALHRAVDGLVTNGSTNLEAGLARGIEIARAARARDALRPVRMMLFTDEQPNVGATTPAAFGGMVAAAAEDDIGITVFGAGNGLGQEIFLAMSHLRGGNAFSLFRAPDVDRLMEESWPWLMVPVAYDLHVEAAPSEGLLVTRGHGFPTADGAPATLDASTVFLSRRRGALLVELAGEEAALASGSVALALSYTEPSGAPVEDALVVSLPAAAGEAAYAQPATRSAVALALLVVGMREAAEDYRTDRARAVATLRSARDRFAADVAASTDASLSTELELAGALLALMEAGAPQR